MFVVRDGKASRAEVLTGRRRPGEVEVLNGVVEGDVVVIEGTQKVREGVSRQCKAGGAGLHDSVRAVGSTAGVCDGRELAAHDHRR